jgi:hypothetical protein
MPNISFDIFFDQDFINITATRGKVAPKAKPEWKVRSAPKLPPKQAPAAQPGSARPAARPKINEGRTAIGKPAKAPEVSDAASQTGDDKPRRKPPKLGPRKSAATNSVNGSTSE